MSLFSLLTFINILSCSQSTIFLQSNPKKTLIYIYNPIPSNYTIVDKFKTSSPIQKLLYSPDEQYIVYTKLNDYENNVVYFRNRSALGNEYFVNVGDPKTQRIQVIIFSVKGEFLFVATSRAIYTCCFSIRMRDEDCQIKTPFKLASLEETTQSVNINSHNQLVLNSDTVMFVWNISSNGSLDLWRFSDINNSTFMRSKWHPLATDQIIVFGGCINNSTLGYIKFFNLTSNSFSFSVDTQCIYSFDYLPDGNTILASSSAEISAFGLTSTSAMLIGTILSKGFDDIRVSIDGTIMIGQQNMISSQRYLEVYTLTGSKVFKDNNSQTNHNKLSEFSRPFQSLTPTLIASLPSNGSNLCTSSSDGNQILLTIQGSTELTRYTLCFNDTFYSNYQCLKCSSNCSNCHRADSTCLTCINSSYAVSQGVCVSCGNLLNGCMTCDNSTFCIYCDQGSNFIQDPIDGICKCKQFLYLLNKTCVSCDAEGACKQCTDSNNCLSCDKENGFAEQPVNGKCVASFGMVYIFVILAGVLVFVAVGVFLYCKWKRRKPLTQEDQQKVNRREIKGDNQKENRKMQSEIKVQQVRPNPIYKEKASKVEPSVIKRDKQKIQKPDSSQNNKPFIIPPIHAHEFEEQIIVEPIAFHKMDKRSEKKKKRPKYQEQQIEKPLLEQKPDNRQVEPSLVGQYNKLMQQLAPDNQRQDNIEQTVRYGDALFAQLSDEEKMRLGLFRD